MGTARTATGSARAACHDRPGCSESCADASWYWRHSSSRNAATGK